MSVLKQTKKEIKKKFPEIHSVYYNRFSNFIEFITKLSFPFIYVIFLIGFIFPIGYTALNCTFLNFINIDFNETLKLLTTGAITFVSINLFVTNLLMTHLKEERDNLEIIIQRKAKFKFITYYGFTIVLNLLILNLVYKTFEGYKVNILLLLTYSFLIFIILVVNLYSIVFKLIYKRSREKILKSELHKEFDKIFYENKFKKEFGNKITDYFESKNFKKIGRSFYFLDENLKNNFNSTIKFKEQKYLRDIKLEKIKKLLNTTKSTDNSNNYFVPISLDENFSKESDFLLLSTEVEYKKISSYYIFKNKPKFLNVTDPIILSVFFEIMEKNIINGQNQDLENDLKRIDYVIEQFFNNY